jgi:hypothetical protein
MSEQSDAVNRTLRERGVEIPVTPPLLPADDEDKNKRELPPIELVREGRRLADFAADAGRVCKGAGVFRREVVPVTINEETALMEAMDADRFRSYLEDRALTFVWKSSGRGEPRKVPCTMAVQDARGCLRADQFVFQLPRLQKINVVRQPVIRKSGVIELLPIEYDEEAGVYTLPNPVQIDESWTLDRAVTFLRDLLKDFPFLDQRSLAVHVASMVSLFAPGLQNITAERLGFLYSSNSPGGGKTLLVSMAVVPVMATCETLTITDDKPEFRKVLDSAVMGSIPYLFFDELEGNIRNKELNAFITSNYRTGRLMGSQKMFRAPRLTVCYLAGNNLTLEQDITRRVLECKLYVEEADNRDRKIEHEISPKYLERLTVRGDILSALWALIRAWIEQGRPGVPNVYKGFGEWCQIYGGIVKNAGFEDPTIPPPPEQSGDTVGDDMRVLVMKLAENIGVASADGEVRLVRDFSFEDIINVCVENGCFQWMIERKLKKYEDESVMECTPRTASSMGKLLSDKYGGRIFRLPDGRRIRFSKRGKNRQRRYEVSLVE